MKKLCVALLLFFMGTTGVLAYLTLVRGTTTPSTDGRTAILLSEGERELVLAEMRGFLEAVQQILNAVPTNDVAGASRAARQVGANAQQQVPASLVRKLPADFKVLGFNTHERFDELAMGAEEFNDITTVLPALASLMGNCVACHATYRIDLEAE